MKKIKSIRQLKEEKKRIKQHQEYLENKVRSTWSELKECLKPGNIAKEAFSSEIKNKTSEKLNSESILKNIFTYGVMLLTKKLVDKAGGKLEKIFRR